MALGMKRDRDGGESSSEREQKSKRSSAAAESSQGGAIESGTSKALNVLTSGDKVSGGQSSRGVDLSRPRSAVPQSRSSNAPCKESPVSGPNVERGNGIPRGECALSGSGKNNRGTINVLTESSNSKRPKLDIAPPEGWRTAADEVRRSGALESARNGDKPNSQETQSSHRSFAVVCSANFNRSMMAHQLLQEHDFKVRSYGTGRDVRLPGKDAYTPQVFSFGTPYLDIYDELHRKDEEFFRRNNLLGLLARNAVIKLAPQRFQEIAGPKMTEFDVVLCFESRVFHLVVEDLQSRDPEMFKPLHVVNMTIKDSPEESAAAAANVLGLCRMLDKLSDLDEDAGEALERFAKNTKRTILHQVCHV